MNDRYPPAEEPGDPLELELRRSLAARAQDAPDPDALTDRLLAAGAGTTTGATPLHRRGWSTWGTPLVAAACVLAIVGIVLAILRPGHSDDGPDAVATPSLPVPVTRTVTVAPSTAASTTTSSPASTTSTGGTTVLHDVRVTDLTFTGEDTGWALASSDCLVGSGRCTAPLLRTTNGSDWTPLSGTPPFRVPGVGRCPAATCVEHLRFANDRIGFAYGPDALYRTTDGARTWTKQTGGAVALETLNDDVIRVGAGGTVATADLGSTTWTTRSLPEVPAKASGFALARTSSAAYVVSEAAATGDAASVLWASTNDGQTWTNRGPACPSGSNIGTGEGLAVSPDGAAALACRAGAGTTTVVVGTRAGLSLQAGAAVPQSSDTTPFVAAASRTTVLAGTTRLYRSIDAGSAWTARGAVDVSGGVSFAGFESATVGRLVTDDGQIVWTTRTAGRTWTRFSF